MNGIAVVHRRRAVGEREPPIESSMPLITRGRALAKCFSTVFSEMRMLFAISRCEGPSKVRSSKARQHCAGKRATSLSNRANS
jgi:hypothetical protein